MQAFISVGMELWLIENVDTGERAVVNRTEYTRVFGEEPPDELTPVAPDKTGVPLPRIHPLFDTELADVLEDEGYERWVSAQPTQDAAAADPFTDPFGDPFADSLGL